MREFPVIKKYRTYIIYASSIFFGKGLEYISILIIAYLLTKEEYGLFEFYKKTIELFSVFIAFGTPSLILTYTKSRGSKVNFFVISIAMAFMLALLSFLILSFSKYAILVAPVLYYATFHYSNSITQSYNLVEKGSIFSSKYKYIFSIFFNGLLLLIVYCVDNKAKSIIYVSYPLLIIGVLYFFYDFNIEYNKGSFAFLKKYYKVFKKQMFNSITLVLNSLSNTAFLVTDVYVIKHFIAEGVRNQLIADYSMVLNIANILLILPLTLINVDLESYKKGFLDFEISLNKIYKFTIYLFFILCAFYFLLIRCFLLNYKNTFFLFIIIALAKVFQSFTMPYGVFLATRKFYTYNMYVNFMVLTLNIFLSVVLINSYGVYGVAMASIATLIVRFLLLKNKYANLKL